MAQVNDSLISSVRTVPKDAQIIAAILKDMDINDYEPRVLNQLLEYANRYVGSIIEEAQTYANHAGRTKTIDARDVDLAIRLQHDKNFSSVPDREVTVEIARIRNSIPLPLIKSSAGLRLPPDRYTLTSCNYRLKSSSKKQRTVHTVSRLTMSSLAANSGNKGSPSISNLAKPLPTASILPKPITPLSVPVVTKSVSSVVRPTLTTVPKFPEGNTIITTSPLLPTISTAVTAASPLIGSLPQILIPTMGAMPVELKMPTESIQVKMKLEDDDYEIK